ALTLQIIALQSCRRNRRHERIDALQRVIQQKSSLGDYVMATAFAAPEQLHEIEALTDHARITVEAVIRNDDQHRFRGQRTPLNGSPDSSEQRINSAQRFQM